jgi:hypothetical protein
MSQRKRIAAAARRLKRFSGHDAKRVQKVNYEIPDTALLVGPCLGIMYETVRDGVREQYVHRFRRNSRPHLAASHDGKFLILLGGAYRFTDRGIVDLGRKR